MYGIRMQVVNIKKTLKNTQQQDMEEQMVTDSKDISQSAPEKPIKKTSKTKGYIDLFRSLRNNLSILRIVRVGVSSVVVPTSLLCLK